MSARPWGGRDVVAAALVVSLLAAYCAATAPLLGFALIACIVLASWVVSRPELVLFVLVAAMPWEAMLNFPTESLSVVKLLGLALAAAYFLQATRRGAEMRFPPTLVLALLLGMVVGVSLLVSPELSLGLTKGIRYAFFIGFLFLIVQMVGDREIAKGMLRVLCLATVAAGLYGIFLFITGAVERASGPIEDPNDFAYMTATVLPVAAYLYGETKQSKPLWGFALFVLLAATALTLSRGALVGLGALLLWAVLSRRIGATRLFWTGITVVGLTVIAFAIWAPLINERLEEKDRIGSENVSSRTSFWSAAEQMTYDHPLLGIGPGRFGVEAPNYVRNNPIALQDPVVHNMYLEVLVESGPLALALFLLMIISAWMAAAAAERQARNRGDPQIARLAATVKAMLIVATVSGLFLSEQVAPPIWLACGLAGSGALALVPAVRPRRTGTSTVLAQA
ncbi:MAG TPA: O-antigen ligase family protein [Solirubrobacterales bacterium]|jgi:O-antigen ligase|nr:O-antigen ligase family protein [Solirubrobacterales bacterium]